MEGEEAPLTLDLRDLQVISVLGRGAKGVAFHVRHGNDTLALKAISKASIERKKSGDSYRRIWFERDVLSTLQHPLLPKLCGFVVTEKIVGFAIQLCSGGDLSSLRKKQTEKMFSDEIIRFYAAELVLALEYLHGLGIAYRDLKPENIMIQENGHLMLIDFDLSAKLSPKSPDSSHKTSNSEANSEPIRRKKKSGTSFLRCISRQTSPAPAETSPSSDPKTDSDSEKSNSFVGTEDYVAPEIISGKGHDFSVDWWSLGVVLYEMLYGRTPFRGCNRKETFYRILTKSPELVGEPTPLRDLIGRLLEKEPLKRISLEGIKGHAFFRGVDWENVPRISRPPFIPADAAEKEMEGNSGIDIEEFVQSVFGGEESGKEKSFGKENAESNNNGGVWVDALSCAPENNDQFFIF